MALTDTAFSKFHHVSVLNTAGILFSYADPISFCLLLLQVCEIFGLDLTQRQECLYYCAVAGMYSRRI